MIGRSQLATILGSPEFEAISAGAEQARQALRDMGEEVGPDTRTLEDFAIDYGHYGAVHGQAGEIALLEQAMGDLARQRAAGMSGPLGGAALQ
jgi:hypothetical protein